MVITSLLFAAADPEACLALEELRVRRGTTPSVLRREGSRLFGSCGRWRTTPSLKTPPCFFSFDAVWFFRAWLVLPARFVVELPCIRETQPLLAELPSLSTLASGLDVSRSSGRVFIKCLCTSLMLCFSLCSPYTPTKAEDGEGLVLRKVGKTHDNTSEDGGDAKDALRL